MLSDDLVGLVEEDPVWSAVGPPRGLDLGWDLEQIAPPLGLVEAREIDDDTGVASPEERHDRVNRWRWVVNADHDRRSECSQADVVTFGVNDENGILQGDQLLGEQTSQVRLPVPTASGDDHVRRSRRKMNRLAVGVLAEFDRRSRTGGPDAIGACDVVQELDDTGTSRRGEDEIGFGLQRIDRVGHGDPQFGRSQERVVVLGISDGDAVVAREPERAQNSHQAAALVDPGWQHHEFGPVANELTFEPKLADDVQDLVFVRVRRGHDDRSLAGMDSGLT